MTMQILCTTTAYNYGVIRSTYGCNTQAAYCSRWCKLSIKVAATTLEFNEFFYVSA